MKCTKCGSDAVMKDGDWLTCLNCGNVMFDTRRPEETAAEISPTKLLEQMEAAAAQEEAPPLRRTRPEKKRKSRRKAKAAADKAEEKNPVKDIVDFMLPIVIAVILALLLKTLVFANAVVPSGSMLSTIEIGDRIVASRLAYIINDPQRYDVVIFKYPDDERQNYVKRIIGLPGETVEIKDGTVYVTQTNGKTIQLRDDFVTYCTPVGDYGPYKVPEDSYFMMGDNRNDSEDSRFWDHKFVKKKKIVGKVVFCYYPSIHKIK